MKKIRLVQQLDDDDCGPASLSMLLKKKYNLNLTISELKVLIGTTKKGSSFLGMKYCLTKLGIPSDVFECKKVDQIFQEIEYPFITQMKADETYHFITVFRKKNGFLIIGDPSKNKIEKIKIRTFMKNWIPYVLTSGELEDLKVFEKYKKVDTNQVIAAIKILKLPLLFSWILSLIIYVIAIFMAGMYSTYFDTIIPNKYFSIIGNMMMMYMSVLFVQFILKIINAKLMIKMNNLIDKSLINELITNFFNNRFNVLESFESGELVTRFSSISQVRERTMSIVQLLPFNIVVVVLTFVLLFQRNFFLTLLVFIPIIIFSLLIYFSHDKFSRVSYQLFNSSDEFNTIFIESINNVDSVKNYSIGLNVELKLKKALDTLLHRSEIFFTFDTIQVQIKNATLDIFNILIFSFGAYLIINDELALGTLLVFNALTMKIFNPFLEMSTLQSTIEQGRVARLKLDDIVVSSKEEEVQGLELKKINSIELKNLSYSYGFQKKILENVNLRINRFENVAIIGNSGSGKTTLAKIIASYYEIDDGNVLLNDFEFSNFSINDRRNKILYSPQSIQCFSESVLYNITLGKKISFDKVQDIVMKLNFQMVIDSLPDGYDTILGAKGVNLSGGQLQLLNIVRAIVNEYEVLIFDEVTNGLDMNLKQKAEEFLLDHDSTKIFITHDIEFALQCDKIYYIQEGSISSNLKHADISQKELQHLFVNQESREENC